MIEGRRVAVVGAGRSGTAAAAALRMCGAEPTIYDRSPTPPPDVIGNWDQPFTKSDCDLVVTSPGVPMQSAILQGSVANGLEVWSEIELAYRVSSAPIIAITGTNGKSTTTVMTYLGLQAAGFAAVLCGNIAGSGYPEVTLTEAAAMSTEDQVLVAEVSSFQLEWIREFHPVCAVITNIEEDHLDRYDGDASKYAAMKHRIYANLGASDCVVAGPGVTVKGVGSQVLRFGVPGSAAWSDSQSIWIGDQDFQVSDLPFREAHNLLNAQAAILAARSFAGPRSLPAIFEGIRYFVPLDNRVESIGSRNSIEVINNTMCTNPAAVIASSRAINRRQHLLMGGMRKQLNFERVGSYLAESGHRAYLFGADRNEINEQMGGQWPLFDTMKEAFAAATDWARPGEVIMLAPGCASQDQFEDFRHRGTVFKEIAKEWLNEN